MAFFKFRPLEPLQPAYHTSALLQTLIDGAAGDSFTLDWLISGMPRRSYGLIILLLSVMTLLPAVSIPARLILMLMGVQILIGYPITLPRRLLQRPLSTRYLHHLKKHAIPALLRLEKLVRPRWEPFLNLRRLSGVTLLLLCLFSLILPVPFINIPPAILIFLMALAYIEHDGLLLIVVQAAALFMLAVMAIAVAGMAHWV